MGRVRAKINADQDSHQYHERVSLVLVADQRDEGVSDEDEVGDKRRFVHLEDADRYGTHLEADAHPLELRDQRCDLVSGLLASE